MGNPKSLAKGAVTAEDLIKKAKSVINPVRIGRFLVGDVGCALLTDKDNVYTGVCIDSSSGMGFCAEHSAIAAMVTAGEYRIKKLVALCKYKGEIYVLPPCGRCRQFIKEIHKDNLNSGIIIGKNKAVKLSELLPYHNLFKKI